MAKKNASLEALEAAEALVAYIKFFRTHGTGDTMRRYPDDDAFGGYDNIVRRAHQLAEVIENFDGRRGDRVRELTRDFDADDSGALKHVLEQEFA